MKNSGNRGTDRNQDSVNRKKGNPPRQHSDNLESERPGKTPRDEDRGELESRVSNQRSNRERSEEGLLEDEE